MKFGLIIFALCLFPFVASQARSEDKRFRDHPSRFCDHR
jgi:hypothetical protein